MKLGEWECGTCNGTGWRVFETFGPDHVRDMGNLWMYIHKCLWKKCDKCDGKGQGPITYEHTWTVRKWSLDYGIRTT